MNKNNIIYPNYSQLNSGELYSHQLDVEYMQCKDEGLDISSFESLFGCINSLPDGINREKTADVLFNYILNARTVHGYKYNEPSDLSEIEALRDSFEVAVNFNNAADIADRISGAWYGRICGCLLGKTVEGIRTDEFYPFLKETDNFPLKRYILSSDISDKICNKYKFGFKNRCYADKINGMPVDDDTNYTVFYQYVVDKYGRNFTSQNIADEWLAKQCKETYFTAERVAYFNFIRGYLPPDSASYKNPYREWIGAQIRGDYFGYINIGNPEKASEMAFRDARISHNKNGIYGEMFVSAMIAAAFCETDVVRILKTGLHYIPKTSRLYEKINSVIEWYHNGLSYDEAVARIHKEFDEHLSHHWCHTISNAMIVAVSLLYGESDYSKSICLAVQAGFDTDCNGATVGSVIGMMKGRKAVEDKWTYPLNDTLETYMLGYSKVSIEDCIKKTVEHIME